MSVNAKIPVEELRQLKSLLDEGIITEKEFVEKKEQLLNLTHFEDIESASVDQQSPSVKSEMHDDTANAPKEKMSDQYMWSIRYEEVAADTENAPNSIASKEENKPLPVNVLRDEKPSEKNSGTVATKSDRKPSSHNRKRKILDYSELCEEITDDVDDLFERIDNSLAYKQETDDLNYFKNIIDFFRKWKKENDYDSRVLFERSRYTEGLYNGFNAYLSNSDSPESTLEKLSEISEIIGVDEMPMKYFSDMTKPMVGWDSGQYSYLLKDYDKAKYIGISKYALAFAALLGAKTFHGMDLPRERNMVIADIATEALCLGFWYANLTSAGVLFKSEIAQKAKNRKEYYDSIVNGSRTQYGSWAKPFFSEGRFDELAEYKEGRVLLAFGDQIIPYIIKRQQPSTSIIGLLFGKPKTEEKKDDPDPYYICLLRFLLNHANIYFKVLEQCKNGNSKYLPNRIVNFSYR